MHDYNSEDPKIMHIDLNSCFATIEQQSRPLLRNRPVVIVNRNAENTAIVTASYEAKSAGIKVGMKLREAKKIIPEVIGLESDPPKYRYVYHKLLNIMNDYSSHVTMKSIDEGCIDFHSNHIVKRDMSLVDIAMEIKSRLKSEIGCAMRCNIGIGTNRFLAKLAADLHKPDGLDIITKNSLRETYEHLKLTDLTGIAKGNEKKLNSVSIITPLQFLDTSEETLVRVVFRGVEGHKWYKRLRGYEVDDLVSNTKRVGRQYVLENRNMSKEMILQRLHNLCESVGERLRKNSLLAKGVYVYSKDSDRECWHNSKLMKVSFNSNQVIYDIAKKLFDFSPDDIIEIGIHCYSLSTSELTNKQISLFNEDVLEGKLSSMVDDINGTYGERTIFSASTLETNKSVKQKIPFGSTKYL
jgi:DNA polymerase-4